MIKYWEIIKIGWKDLLAYRFEVYNNAIFSFFRIILAFIMWKTIFANKAEVSGFTFNTMLTYYILVTLLTRLEKSHDVADMLAKEVRSGNFTKYITKPINPIGNYFAMVFSRFSYVLGVNIAATILWAVIFREQFVMPADLSDCLWAVLIYALGLFFLALLNYFFTILSFWVLDVIALFMIKDNLLGFVSGALIPLSLLPAEIIGVFKFLPFYYIYYYPIALYLNQTNEGIMAAVFVLAGWSAVLFAADILLYRAAIKSYDGVGI